MLHIYIYIIFIFFYLTASTPVPSNGPTPAPTNEPTAAPTNDPTPAPTNGPTAAQTNDSTPEPTNNPITAPTNDPIMEPTNNPIPTPTKDPDEADAAEYEIKIEIDDSDKLSAEQLDKITGDILNIDNINSVKIISIDNGIITLSVTTDNELDTEQIDQKVTDTLDNEYPGIKVDVNKAMKKDGNDKSQDVLFYLVIIIVSLAGIGLVGCVVYNRRKTKHLVIESADLCQTEIGHTTKEYNDDEIHKDEPQKIQMISMSVDSQKNNDDDNVRMDDDDDNNDDSMYINNEVDAMTQRGNTKGVIDDDSDEELYAVQSVPMTASGNDNERLSAVPMTTSGNDSDTKRSIGDDV